MFISGATGGLGKAFAVECARRGWDLFLSDVDPAALEILESALERTYGIDVLQRACDLTEAEDRSSLCADLERSPCQFRGLINVAGTDFEGFFLERSREQLQTIIRLNVEATLDLTHALLAKTDPGITFRIINVSSLAAFFPMPVKATYAASKRFLLDFSLALRDELRIQGTTVTVLCPAGLPTTEKTITAIEAQGLMGQLTTQNIGSVAAGTLDAAHAGRAVYIPGRINRLVQWLGGLVPRLALSKGIGSRWRAAHRRRSLALNEHWQQIADETVLDLAA